LAEPGAGAVDGNRWRGDGVVVCEAAEYFDVGDWAGVFRVVRVVGVSVAVAPFDAGGAGVLEVSFLGAGSIESANVEAEKE